MAERLTYTENFKPEIPGYKGRVYYFGEEQIPIHLDEHKWEFETENGTREIPVLSVWNYKNHDKIAAAITDGKRIGMYMWGTFGTGYLLNFPEWQKKESDEAKDLRTKLKIGRPKDQSFPVIIHPDDEWMFWDFDKLHKNLRYLRDAQRRYDLYQSGPIHIIAPRKPYNPYLDESLRWPKDNTACFYYMPHPGWEKIIEKTRKHVKHAVFAGGSLNPHKMEPVYTTLSLYNRTRETVEWTEGLDLIVVCEISEFTQVFRGQTQIRLAQVDSGGISEVVRRGNTHHGRWSQEQGVPIKDASEGVKDASSYRPYTAQINYDIDTKVQEGVQLMKEFDRKDARQILKAP